MRVRTHVSDAGDALSQTEEAPSEEEPRQVDFARNLNPALELLHDVE